MPYILSPEQKVVVDALTSKETSSTKYFDIDTAMQSLCKACTTVLEEGKNILIHIPDKDRKELLTQIFSTNGLVDLTIDLSDRSSMPEVDIIKLRSTLKKQKDSDAIIKHVLSLKRAATQKESIDIFYGAFDAKVMSDTSFRDFVTNYIYQIKEEVPFLNEDSNIRLQFSASEYYRIKKEIKTAIQIYHNQYDLFDHLSLFKPELWNDITEIRTAEIKNKLLVFKAESAKLCKDFAIATKELINSSSKAMAHTISSLEEKFLQHEEACIAYHIKSSDEHLPTEGKFSLFKKKKTQLTNKIYVDAFDELSGMIQTISQEWYDALDAPTSEMITYDYIIDFIENNRAKTSNYQAKSIDNMLHSIQRINKINTNSESVKSLDKRLEGLIQKMNDSSLFNLDLDHNILSFVKQSELCKNIEAYIEKCNVLVNSSSSYLEWKSFYNSTDGVFKLIFEAMKRLSKNEWIAGFEYWYKYQIQNHVLGEKSISSQKMNSYFTHATIANNVEISAVIARLHTQRLEAIKNLKVTSKELYNTLFKKKQLPSVSWQNTAMMNLQFMQSFFPIHISDSTSYAKDYDLVISITSDVEIMEPNTHYFSPIQSKDIQNISEKKDHFLYLNDYKYSGPLRELSSTDKLKASKKLAKYILSLNQSIKIYQLKEANVISLLPAYDDSYLENVLNKINAKVIDTQGVLYDRLTESILFTEKRPFLIIKDELINCELHEHTLWQLKLIQLFKEVGYEVLSLNTTNQMQNNDEQFSYLLQKIRGTLSEKITPEIKNTDKIKSVPEQV